MSVKPHRSQYVKMLVVQKLLVWGVMVNARQCMMTQPFIRHQYLQEIFQGILTTQAFLIS